MKKITHCNLCSSTDFRERFRLSDHLYGVPGAFTLMECTSCGLLFLNPQPSPQELEPHYPKHYMAYKEPQDGRNQMIELLYRVYLSPQGHRFLGIVFFPVKHLLRSMPKKESARYLDVGCGNGRFLWFVKEQGMVPYGVDPFIHEENKVLNIRKVHLLDAGFPENYFDFITLNNVLEHVEDPEKILRECKRIVKKKGKIIINVPNATSLQYILFSSVWVSLDPPRHLFIFSKKTLRGYAQKVGLTLEKIRYKSEPFSILGSLVAAARSGEKGTSGNKVIANRWVNILILPFSILLNLLRISDQVEITLRKD